jgi:hypothetical protein
MAPIRPAISHAGVFDDEAALGAAVQDTVPLPVHSSPEHDADPVAEICVDRIWFNAEMHAFTSLAPT